jgi:hypothetical protein
LRINGETLPIILDPFRTLMLVTLFVINWMMMPRHWWARWAALGIGIAWMFSLLGVLRAIVVAGGLAALAYPFIARPPDLSRAEPRRGSRKFRALTPVCYHRMGGALPR